MRTNFRIQELIYALRIRFRALTCFALSVVVCLLLVGCDEDLEVNPDRRECEGWTVGQEFTGILGQDFRPVRIYTFTRKSPNPQTYTIRTDEDLATVCQKANVAFGQKASELRALESSPERAVAQAITPAAFVAFNQAANDIQFPDLDGDGQKDIVLVFDGENAVTIVRAAGTNLLAPVKFPTGINPLVVRAGDVNGDGKVDLITANMGAPTGSDYSGGDVSLLLGNGNGTFQPAISIAAGEVPRDVGLGDFNEDGKLDLVIADNPSSASHQLLLRLGNGDGTFHPTTVIDTQTADSLAVVQLNGDIDNHEDLVTNGSILLGRGDGTFAPATLLPLTFNMTLNVVKVGDLNSDGKPDVIVGSFGNEVIGVFLGNGDGTLREAHIYPVNGSPENIEIGDLDNDGRIDIAGSNSSVGSTRLFGNVDGTFQAAELYAAVPSATGRQGASGAVVADFTGDGVPDIVVANGGYFQGSLNDPLFTEPTAVLMKGLGAGKFAAAAPIPKQAGSRVIAGDWNGDGKQDLAFTGDGVVKPQLFTALGKGDGTFSPQARIDLPGGRRSGENFITSAFLNGDAAADLLVANFGNGDLSIFLGDGKGAFAAQPSVPIGVGPNGIALGDLNKDGKLDLVITYLGRLGFLEGGVKVALGNGDGTFQAIQTVQANVGPDGVAMADFNGDGKLDLAISLELRSYDWDVEILLGNGDGTFGAPLTLGLIEDLISGVVVADVDLDGKPDLAVTSGGGRVLGYRGKGDGTFERALSAVTGGGQMQAADLDRNDLPDLVSSLGDGFVAVYRNPLADASLVRPALRFLRAAGALDLTWPGVFKGFSLKEADTLSPPVIWKASTNAVNLSDDQFHTIIETMRKSRFFRLEKTP
jgi:hypothetical protein